MSRTFAWAMGVVLAIGVGITIAVWWANRDAASDSGWLFSHTAEGGDLMENGDGSYTLTLTGIDAHVMAFTDRPERDAFVVDAVGLVAMWSDFFADSDPNAVLVEHGADGEADSIVLTLSDPSIDEQGLTFTALPLIDEVPAPLVRIAGKLHRSPPTQFSAVSLFIDDAEPASDCVSGDSCQSPVERGILCNMGYDTCRGIGGNGGTGGSGGLE